MGADWVIASFPHDAADCGLVPGQHVHCGIIMTAPEGIRDALRESERAVSSRSCEPRVLTRWPGRLLTGIRAQNQARILGM